MINVHGVLILLLAALAIATPLAAADDSSSQDHRIHWTIAAANPVIVPGQLNPPLDAKRTAGGYVVVLGNKYRMYYWATDRQNVNRICMAETAVDRPNAWKGLGAVLEPQPETYYNANGPVCPMVLVQDDGPWLMYVGAIPREPAPGEQRRWHTGLAASRDQGLTWKYLTQKPLIASDRPYDVMGTGTVSVLREKNEYGMYYTATADWERRPANLQSLPWQEDFIPITGIGYAVSKDGIAWEKPRKNFLIPPRRDAVEPYEHWIAKPMVVKEKRGYRMWVSAYGTTYRIYSLTSDDGINWQWVPSNAAEGDLGVGKPGAFDDEMRCYAMVVRHGDEYRMWYTGNSNGATGMGYATARVPK